MRITNKLGLPNALVRAVSAVSADYDRGDAEYTVTQLIGPPKISLMRAKYDDALEIDVSSLIYAAEGSAFHTLMERSERMGFVEERVYTELDGTRISGKFDLLYLADTGKLQDFKRTSVFAISKGTKFEWVAQTNMLAWILMRNERYVTELEIVPVFRDWMKSRARTDKEYPQTQSLRIPIELWPAAKTEAFIRERIAAHRSARVNAAAGQPLPNCTDDERWTKKQGWAVMKKGGKRASKVFYADVDQLKDNAVSLSDAEDLARAMVANMGPGYGAEFRPGERTRCLDWCEVAAFCEQWQNELARQVVVTNNGGD